MPWTGSCTHGGRSRAQFLLYRLLKRARQLGIGLPPTIQTPYINTISPEHEPYFPGDEALEKRIRRLVRWNAVVMVTRANHEFPGIGGHLSTYASSASLYEVGFNHFFRGKDGRNIGDQIFYQGHAAPGIYARAFLMGRISEEQLEHFRREALGAGALQLPAPAAHARLLGVPDRLDGAGPDLRHLPGALQPLPARARASPTPAARGSGPSSATARPTRSRRWARSPWRRAKGSTTSIFVVNCNLQRLDGPVRGNGKIIQELEAIFRGAGWNVIKVIWGREWDELLARDTDGVLLQRMNETLDGDYQRFAAEDGAHVREHFFGGDPRLRKLVEHLSDGQIERLRRGGHDYRKVYTAYRVATETTGAPTVILAKTVKGWTLGDVAEGRNVTHQIKKLGEDELRIFRDRLELPIPDAKLKEAPYYHPGMESEEVQYMLERPPPARRGAPEAHGGAGRDHAAGRRPLRGVPPGNGRLERAGLHHHGVRAAAAEAPQGPEIGRRIVPIIPDEARTFGMESLFREFRIYSALGQKYTPVDHEVLMSYAEAVDGQILEEGITEAGAMASFLAAGTALRHAPGADDPVLHLLLDVRLPAHRRPGLGLRRRARPRLPARRHRRAHHPERRGAAARGRPLAGARLHQSGLPGLRPGLGLRGRDDRAGRPAADARGGRGSLLLHHAVQRELHDAGDAGGRARGDPPRALPLPAQPARRGRCAPSSSAAAR